VEDLGAAVQAFEQTVLRLGFAVMIDGNIVKAMEEFRDSIEKIAETIERVVTGHQGGPNEETFTKFRALMDAILKLPDDLIALMRIHSKVVSIIVGFFVFMIGAGLLGWHIALRILGFSARGPVKGSLAAWAQIYFWGGAVAKGS